MHTDEELIQQIRVGNPDAIAELYGRYSSMVWRYVYARMRDEHASQDVLSETFLAAIRSLNKGMTAENILGWLTGIARNKIADFYRSCKESGEPQTDPTACQPSPMKATVADVLDALPLDQRQVLEWKYFDRCSVCENAAQEYVASEAIRKLREKPECKAAIEAALTKWFASVEHEFNEIQLTRAATCFVTAAGQEYQELAVDYLFKIWKQFPTLSWEKQIERLGEETELNDLLKQIELNDELANKFAERLTNGTSSDRSLVTYYLIFSTGLKDEKDPRIAELNAWLHNHRELFFPAFSAALKDESEHIRWFSLASLIGLDQKHASTLSTLTSVIESDASTKVRWLAIEMISSKEILSVAKTQNIEITPLLIQTLQSDSSVDVRYAALGALMAMDKDSELVHATLLEWARCKERLQVENALYLMLRNHEVGDRPQSIDELIELLSDSEWGTTVEVKQNSYRWARQYAIANLGEYAAHAHRAIPTLEAELARKNKDTLSFATEALDSVRGFCPDLPIDQLQGEWEFVSVNRPSSTTAFFDFPLHPGGVYPGMGREIRTASRELPPTIITLTGTQLKIGDRVVAEISHHRKLGGFVMLLDPDGRKLHCKGSFRIAGSASPSVGAATSPQTVTLEICKLHNEHDSTQGTKQTYELQITKLH